MLAVIEQDRHMALTLAERLREGSITDALEEDALDWVADLLPGVEDRGRTGQRPARFGGGGVRALDQRQRAGRAGAADN